MAPNSVCFVTSLSKAAAPGLRLGFLAAPAGSAGKYAQNLRATTIQSVPVTAEIGCRWILDGTADRIAASYREESMVRYGMARAALGNLAETGVATPSFFWLELGEGWRGEAFAAAARTRGVVVTGAGDFQTDRGAAPRAVRVCTGPEARRERYGRALEILAELVAEAPGQSLAVT
jgi:DNA-binding transcriptional MocR family regulator